jgi:hypothetical protein
MPMRTPHVRPKAAHLLTRALWLVLLLAPVASGETSIEGRATAAAAVDPSDAIARHLCDVLHALPARRKQECCGTVSTDLAEACTRELAPSLRRNAISIDPAALDRCAEDAARQLEGCGWVGPRPPKAPSSCTTLLEGAVPAGALCSSSFDCRDGLYCRGAAAGRQGICAAPARAHARCAAPADNLAAFTGLQGDPRHAECEGRCVKGQCLPLAKAGAECPSSAMCEPGLHCRAGRCEVEPPPGIGESCAGETACRAGAYCRDGTCVSLKQPGEACSLPGECGGLACERKPGEKTGTCADPCGPGGHLVQATTAG